MAQWPKCHQLGGSPPIPEWPPRARLPGLGQQPGGTGSFWISGHPCSAEGEAAHPLWSWYPAPWGGGAARDDAQPKPELSFGIYRSLPTAEAAGRTCIHMQTWIFIRGLGHIDLSSTFTTTYSVYMPHICLTNFIFFFVFFSSWWLLPIIQ